MSARGAAAGPRGDGGESGQGLVLGVLGLGVLCWCLMLCGVVGLLVADRAAARVAADGAALACAARGWSVSLVDARGVVYGREVRLDQSSAQAAARAAWRQNLRGWPLQTQAFEVSTQGGLCAVRAQLQARIPFWPLIRGGAPPQWAVVAQAVGVPAGQAQ